MKRRIFLKGSLAAGTLAVAAGAGMLTPDTGARVGLAEGGVRV